MQVKRRTRKRLDILHLQTNPTATIHGGQMKFHPSVKGMNDPQAE